MSFYQVLLVGVGGFVGSIARYAAAKAIHDNVTSSFPFGTLTVNIVGSFILGLVLSLASAKSGENSNISLLLGVGFCGGFTTFSAFAFENLSLFQQRLFATTAIYIGASLLLGLGAVFAGLAAGRSIS